VERGRGMMRIWIVLICFLCMASAVSRAQTQQAAPPARQATDTNTDNSEEPDAPVVKTATADSGNAESGTDTAWEMLKTALSDSKAQARQARIDAVTALGTLGDFAQAQKLLRDTAQDSDRYLRFAAVAAMGASKAELFIPDLKAALKDSAPEVSFAAAVGLWKMHDRSGESILYGVLAGERKAKQGAVGSGLHQADQDLHSPSKLAEIGAEQGAYALLGPVGFGVDAFRMMHKGNNANSPRVLTATLLADDNSKATMQQFLDALEDRDSFVRAAAARELGDCRGKQVTDALQGAFDDPKPVVRLMAAASYIRASQPVTARQKPHHRNGMAARSSTQER
jgi:HEAT repeat protein